MYLTVFYQIKIIAPSATLSLFLVFNRQGASHAFRKIKRNAFDPVRARHSRKKPLSRSHRLNAFRFIFRNAWDSTLIRSAPLLYFYMIMGYAALRAALCFVV